MSPYNFYVNFSEVYYKALILKLLERDYSKEKSRIIADMFTERLIEYSDIINNQDINQLNNKLIKNIDADEIRQKYIYKFLKRDKKIHNEILIITDSFYDILDTLFDDILITEESLISDISKYKISDDSFNAENKISITCEKLGKVLYYCIAHDYKRHENLYHQMKKYADFEYDDLLFELMCLESIGFLLLFNKKFTHYNADRIYTSFVNGMNYAAELNNCSEKDINSLNTKMGNRIIEYHEIISAENEKMLDLSNAVFNNLFGNTIDDPAIHLQIQMVIDLILKHFGDAIDKYEVTDLQ